MQVILDVVLPAVHGDELLPMIRQLLGDHVAVVAVSALGELSLVQRCIFRGADSFMVAAADPAVQPYATQAATQAATACNRMYARLHPRVCKAATLCIPGQAAADPVRRAALAAVHGAPPPPERPNRPPSAAPSPPPRPSPP